MDKYVFLNLIQKISDKFFSRDLSQKSVYSDLTPVDNLSNEGESLRALHWALNNPKIKNIALTGPYGAGKSSVIESYLKQHKKCKAINISLATFDGRSWDKVQELLDEGKFGDVQSVQKEFEDELEKGILKQLFYKVDADKIPLSRYRKLHHKNLWKYIIGEIAFLMVILSGTYLVFPQEVIAFWGSYSSGIGSFKDAVWVLSAFLFAIYGISCAIRFITSKFTIKEISVGDISAQGETAPTDSVLNKNIDEMLYFFERTKYNVVFIEDLDRFNNTSVFIKLREINTILNNYDVIRKKGKITFVYAVRDDLFRKSAERTKFFDFLIPIIPVINYTNSGEIMRNLLGIGQKKEKDREYPDHDVSQKFVTLVSPYIGDMRILISTINEFWIYKRTLKESQNVQLKDENMLALMIYKNLYPNDFALLEAEEGNIKEAFRYKAEALKNAQKKLEKQKEELELLQQDVAMSVKDIKVLILAELVEYKGVVTKIIISNNIYNYLMLLKDDYSFDELRKDRIEVYYRPFNSSSEENAGTFSKLEDFNTRFRDLFKRYDRQWKYSDKLIEDYKVEFENIDKEIMELRAKTMQQLIESSPLENILPENVRKNNLLVFLLRHGYINESYADYINYFHAGSISKEELNFILSIRDFKGANDFELNIEHCANVVDRLYDYEFKQKETLNFCLTDFLVESKTNQKKLQNLMRQLVNQSEISLRYIKAYIDRGKHIEQFIQLLCHESNLIWAHMLFDNMLSDEKRDEYFKLIIRACEIQDIANNNISYEDREIYCDAIIQEYFENDEEILLKMKDIPWSKVKAVVENLDVKFSKLSMEGLKMQIVDDIIENRWFELNPFMLTEIFKAKNPEGLDDLFRANYGHVRKLGCKELLDYVYDDFSSYVQVFILNEELNNEEKTEDVNDILERLFEISQDMCIEVIEKEHLAYWRKVSDCLTKFEDNEKQKIWDYLLINNRTAPTWENYLLYRNIFGLSSTLLQYFNENIDAIIENGGDEDITDEIIKELIMQELSDIAFEKVVSNYRVAEFTDMCCEFKESKLKTMIHKHYFDFTPERLAELKEISRELSLEFMLVNQQDFKENIEKCDIDVKDIKDIINLGFLEEKDLLELLKLIEPTAVDDELALLLRNLGFLLPKEYVEAMWQVLEEKDKYQVLYDQMDVFSLDEIAEKFKELGGVYMQFSTRVKHKYDLFKTEFNEALCQKLYKRGFLSSCEILEEKAGVDNNTSKDKYEKHIVGFVKKKSVAAN